MLGAALAALAIPPRDVRAAIPPGGAWVRNVAHGIAVDSITGQPIAASSDTVRAWVAPAAPPMIAFYTDPTYAAPTRTAQTGDELLVQALAPGCDTPGRDSVWITLRSQRTGDVEVMLAREVMPGGGMFRVAPFVPLVQVTTGAAGRAAGLLEVMFNDHVTATLAGCGATLTEAELWLDASGAVSDAISDAPVPGARVRLLDVTGAGNGGIAGGLARVYDWDRTSPAPAEWVTGVDGRYTFPHVAAGTYQIVVEPPSGWRFPSRTPHTAGDPAHLVDPDASYGRPFTIGGAGGPVVFDVPVDPLSLTTLFVEKTVPRPVVEPGDDFELDVKVANRSPVAVDSVRLVEQLPPGFSYVRGTARLDGTTLADPSVNSGSLGFALGTLAPGAEVRVRYRARVGPAAPLGDAITTSQAAGGDTVSNLASARLTVVGGPFAEEALVVGAVFVDLDGDRRQGPGDTGVPGVRVWVDDGTWAMTDAAGRYSLYGLTPRTHVLKLDGTSLPTGTHPVAADHRDARPGLRFVDLQRGDVRSADFALAADSVALPVIQDRVRAIAGRPGEAERSLGRTLPVSPDPLPPGDPRARPVSGVEEGAPPVTPALPAPPRVPAVSGAAIAPASGAAFAGMVAAVPIEARLQAANGEVGFLEPADGDTVSGTQVRVRVKGLEGPEFFLSVNGVPVPSTRVGRRVSVVERGLAAWEYIGVALRPGVNELEVRQAAHGAPARAVIRVLAPDRLGRLALVTPAMAPADGNGMALVRVRALDARGVRVPGRRFVTLESSLGAWVTPDLDPEQAGLQVAVVDGEGRAELAAPPAPGTARLSARCDDVVTTGTLEFVPELRPLVVLGVAEGIVSFDHRSDGVPARPGDRTGFEQEISRFADMSADGRAFAGARASLFARGRVGDDMLLTLGYDSDRPDDLRRFRDMQPGEYYPVTGDGAVRGYEAQSSGSLYARLDRRNGWVTFGDFLTGGGAGARTLGAYARSLSGAATHWETRRARVDAFTSRERARRTVIEIAGRGVSGPYRVPGAPFVENGEQVEILVRDRDQPAVVLRRTSMQRFVDYELDPLTGDLLFKQPVPSLEGELDPVSIRVIAEVRDGGEPAWVSGVDGRVQVANGLEVGGSYVDDHDPARPYELRSAYIGARAGRGTVVEGEWAVTRSLADLASVSGDAGRVELRHESAAAQGRLYGAMTDSTFDNPGAGFGAGRTEMGTRWDVRMGERTRLLAEGLYTGDVRGDVRRGGLLVSVAQGLGQWSRGEFGVRVSGERRRAGDEAPDLLSFRTRLTAQLPSHPALSGWLEGEQDLRTPGRNLLAAGGEYRLPGRGRVYLRHELLSSLGGAYAMDAGQRRLSTVVGVDADVRSGAHVFSEYRLADALSGREAEAAIGLRNTWRVGDRWRLGTTFERVEVLEGAAGGPSTAITAALETAEDEDVLASGRVEVRTSPASNALLASAGVARRMDPRWTLLGRAVLHVVDDQAPGVSARERVQAGFAYRPPGPAWSVLGRYELLYDRLGGASDVAHRRIANVLSFHTTGPLAEVVTGSFAWTGKRVHDRGAGLVTGNGAQWVHGRLTQDLGSRWDIGLAASARFGDRLDQVEQGYGAELGRRMNRDLWVSGGWNWIGYQDAELTADEYTRAGFYLRLRAAFDETLFTGLRGGAR